EVDVVEAHGTGTRLGDPIEAQALLATYGRERAGGRPLWLGSVKSNLGHTQAAAGVAGVIKMVLALRHGVVPATLHVDEPSSQVDWLPGGVELLTQARQWPESVERARRAGVSSFGLSGTNAHVILEEAPADPAPEKSGTDDGAVLPWLVSARSAEAQRAQAGRLLTVLGERHDSAPVGLARALASTRTSFEQRSVVLAATREEFVEELQTLHLGETGLRTVTGVTREGGRTAFLFSGQGAQRAGMGRELYEAFPVFADAFDAVCAHVGSGLRDVVFDEDAGRLGRTEWTQPALFAVEVALFRLVESFGVCPDFVIGHSVGEIAAAHVAGVLSLEDACALVVARGRLMQELPSGGVMVAVEAAEDEVLPLLDAALVSVAAVNGPRSVVIAGVEAAVSEVAEGLKSQGRRTSRLRVSHAFHSPLMEPMLGAFREVAERVTYGAPVIPVVSNVTGCLAAEGELGSAEYWVRHVRQAVRFADGVSALAAEGVTRFLEIGPDGTLTALARTVLGDVDDALFVPLLRKDVSEHMAVLRAMARFHVDGGEVDWSVLLGSGDGAPAVDLPTYPFQRQRYWLAPNQPAPGVPAVPVHASAVIDDAFWAAVECEDLPALAADLDLAPDLLGPVVPALSKWYRQRQDRATVDALRYAVSWKPLTRDDEIPPAAGSSRTGNWTVLVPADLDVASRGRVNSLVAGLHRQGLTPHVVETDLADREGLRLALGETGAADGTRAPDGILSLLSFDASADPVVGTLAALRALAESEPLGTRLWVVTHGAVAVGSPDRVTRTSHSAVWGLGRVAALEHPYTWGGLIDLPDQVDDRVSARLALALTRLGPDEDQLAIRTHGIFGRRLSQAAPLPQLTADGWEPRGTVLITGGTGALGAHVARWAVARGARDLLLVSRSGEAAPGVAELRAELQEAGAQVTLAALDVSERDDLAALLSEHPVDAVFHTAGVLDDGTLLTTDAGRVERVMGPKATAALLLDELTRDRDLSAFVLFSSLAGTLGSPGQGAYAAANAVLDALAERRRGEGLPATSIAWGPWAGDGMAADSGGRRRGQGAVTALAPGFALSALGAVLDGDITTQLVVDADWNRFIPAFTESTPRSRNARS
ncbi:type I polyketide synthase, partial [Streptomyces europaeiscabiei]|uniref:type I polyketide synthase n=1 Tax=Streptomyces europaeiscabiei TaxID=146819 RepID=UPI0029B68637